MHQFSAKQFLPAATTRFLGLVVVLLFLALPSLAKALIISPVRVEFSGDPGETVVSKVKATNSEDSTKTYYVNVYSFEAKDESGSPAFKVVKNDLATWVQADGRITLGPKETKTLPFSVSIPKDAEPGGYFAALFLSENPPASNDSGEVALSSEVGSLFLLRVNGEIRQGADILEFGTKNHGKVYNSLPVTFYYRFQNSGQDRVKPLGDIVIRNLFGWKTKILPANKDDGNVLPQSIRRFENTWTGKSGTALASRGFFGQAAYQLKNFAFGPYSVRLNLAFGPQDSLSSATAAMTVWVLPWQLLLLALLLFYIIFRLARFGLRRYNRWVISQAKAAASSGKRLR